MPHSRFASILCIALLPAIAHAARPLAIDDAGTIDANTFELTLGSAAEGESGFTHWDFPAELAYGVLPSVQMSIGFGGQLEKRTETLAHGATSTDRVSGIGDVSVGGKWQFLSACPLGASHTLSASVKFPTADEQRQLGSGKTDSDLTWIVSRDLGERAALHLNLGYSWIGGVDGDVLHYGAAIEVALWNALQWVGEIFAEDERGRDVSTLVMSNAGFRWAYSETLTFDVAGGARIAGESPDWLFTAGLTWQFGPPGSN